jgi:hypothetical protein
MIPSLNKEIVVDYIDNYRKNTNTDCDNLCMLLKNYKNIVELFELTKLIELSGTEEPLRTNLFLLFDRSEINKIINNNYNYGSGAMFIASKTQIRKHSKAYWEKIYASLQQDINPSSGYGLEKMWNYLLNL